MRKTWLAVALAVGIGGGATWGMSVSAQADNGALESYKSALKQTKEAGSLTAHAHLELTDNQTKLFAVDGVAKVDHEQKLGSVDGTYVDANGEGSFQAFREPTQMVFKKGDRDLYRVMEAMDWQQQQPEQDQHAMSSAMIEQVHKTLFGSMEKWTTMENLPDGGKRVSLKLDEEQMPVFAKMLGPIMYAKIVERSQEARAGEAEKGLALELPALQEDVHLEQVVLNATINEQNQIEQQTAKVELVGTDASGVVHTLQLTVDVRLSDLAATTPERVDLTGKQVEKVTREEMRSHWAKGGWRH
ncbi:MULTISPECIES: hypothetical protein [Brevibacillus]|uniref:hypothetical protein n=1 Tax=Brevibacillus TaxID=55080 RepID=UPI00156BA4CE|nr:MULTISPECIES: hypothetical protein [Brevibacillus]MDH6350379.1 hypothetical protein [Brevibacillus sp. 1238]MED2253451.1 hypothetical protein [Brevibacillus parabrevis]NRQ55754.1 hypothetical protein [Brevibacillus sp. HD1.4A]